MKRAVWRAAAPGAAAGATDAPSASRASSVVIGARMALALLSSVTWAPAAAQQAAANSASRASYDREYFVQFSPSTALDMILRLPGFAIEEGAERRGLAGASGNIRVDGRPLASKNLSIEEALARIPASQVLRIELDRGGGTESGAGADRLIANIIRSPTAGAGVWEAEAAMVRGRRVTPRVSATWTGRRGSIDYSASVNGEAAYFGLEGEREVSGSTGDLRRLLTDKGPRNDENYGGSLEASMPMLGGESQVSAQLNHEEFVATRYTVISSPAEPLLGAAIFNGRSNEDAIDIALNHDRPVGSGRLSLKGVLLLRKLETADSNTATNAVGSREVFVQEQIREATEVVFRAAYGRPLSVSAQAEIGVDLAYNALDSNLELTLDVGSGPQGVQLPAADVLVEELRSDAFASIAWRPAEALRFEGTLAVELSSLSQSGDTNQSMELFYFKPSLRAVRRFSAKDEAYVRVWRDVGQLDFDNFVTSAVLADDVIVGGNPDLKPENSWRAELGWDRRLGGDGAVGAAAFYWRLRDAADVIPVGPPGNRIDAPGNIGDGEVFGARLTATVPTAVVLANSRMTIDTTVRNGSVRDPVTGRGRRISGFSDASLDVVFRQDLPERRLAWQVGYFKESALTTFRVREIDRSSENGSLKFEFEAKPTSSIKVTAYFADALGNTDRRHRTFFSPDRLGSVTEIERGEMRFGSKWGVIVSGVM